MTSLLILTHNSWRNPYLDTLAKWLETSNTTSTGPDLSKSPPTMCGPARPAAKASQYTTNLSALLNASQLPYDLGIQFPWFSVCSPLQNSPTTTPSTWPQVSPCSSLSRNSIQNSKFFGSLLHQRVLMKWPQT